MHADRLLLGFDFGTRRIGVAVGQELTRSARAIAVLNARDGQPDWGAVANLLDTWQPDALIVGIPVHMDGTEHAITEAARRFARRLAGRYALPVHEADERLSSEAATALQQMSGDADMGLDAVAATVILESWMNQQDQAHARHD